MTCAYHDIAGAEALIRAQTAQIKRLEEENERKQQIIDMLSARGPEPPPDWDLTDKERDVIAVLLSRSALTREQIRFLLYGTAPDVDNPSLKNIDVLICKIRKVVDHHGMTIGTIYRRGYYIENRLDWVKKFTTPDVAAA